MLPWWFERHEFTYAHTITRAHAAVVQIRLHTERAMCTVLRFSEEEMRRMRVGGSAFGQCMWVCRKDPYVCADRSINRCKLGHRGSTHVKPFNPLNHTGNIRTQEARGAAVSGANSGAGIAGDVTQWASSLFASTTGGGNR